MKDADLSLAPAVLLITKLIKLVRFIPNNLNGATIKFE